MAATGASSLLQSLPYMISSRMTTGSLDAAFIKSTVMSILVVSIVTAIVPKLGELLNGIMGFANTTGVSMHQKLMQAKNRLWTYIFKIKMYDFKSCIITLYPDGKQTNELYDAVDWYLTNDKFVDFTKESPINVGFSKKITTLRDKDEIKLSQSICKGNKKSITYKGHEIWFTFETEVMTFFDGKERKKENKKITLNTQVERGEIEYQNILQDLCGDCVNEYKKFMDTQRWVPKIYVNKNCSWDGSDFDNKRNIETIILKDGRQNFIKRDLDRFLNGSEFYQKIGRPYQHGYLFYGTPGTGKTSMIRAMSNYTKRDVYFVNLNDVKCDNDLFELMKRIPNEKAIVVFEDIDCASDVVGMRSPTPVKTEKDGDSPVLLPVKHSETKTSAVTLSALFNVIDGVFDARGRILIMTTNHPEVLDDALYRPGRIDVKVEFGKCDRKQIGEIYELYFGEKCSSELLERFKDDTYSPAHISTLFMTYILEPEKIIDHIDDNIAKFESKLN
jgi:hypothetical protein